MRRGWIRVVIDQIENKHYINDFNQTKGKKGTVIEIPFLNDIRVVLAISL